MALNPAASRRRESLGSFCTVDLEKEGAGPAAATATNNDKYNKRRGRCCGWWWFFMVFLWFLLSMTLSGLFYNIGWLHGHSAGLHDGYRSLKPNIYSAADQGFAEGLKQGRLGNQVIPLDADQQPLSVSSDVLPNHEEENDAPPLAKRSADVASSAAGDPSHEFYSDAPTGGWVDWAWRTIRRFWKNTKWELRRAWKFFYHKHTPVPRMKQAKVWVPGHSQPFSQLVPEHWEIPDHWDGEASITRYREPNPRNPPFEPPVVLKERTTLPGPVPVPTPAPTSGPYADGGNPNQYTGNGDRYITKGVNRLPNVDPHWANDHFETPAGPEAHRVKPTAGAGLRLPDPYKHNAPVGYKDAPLAEELTWHKPQTTKATAFTITYGIETVYPDGQIATHTIVRVGPLLQPLGYPTPQPVPYLPGGQYPPQHARPQPDQGQGEEYPAAAEEEAPQAQYPSRQERDQPQYPAAAEEAEHSEYSGSDLPPHTSPFLDAYTSQEVTPSPSESESELTTKPTKTQKVSDITTVLTIGSEVVTLTVPAGIKVTPYPRWPWVRPFPRPVLPLPHQPSAVPSEPEPEVPTETQAVEEEEDDDEVVVEVVEMVDVEEVIEQVTRTFTSTYTTTEGPKQTPVVKETVVEVVSEAVSEVPVTTSTYTTTITATAVPHPSQAEVVEDEDEVVTVTVYECPVVEVTVCTTTTTEVTTTETENVTATKTRKPSQAVVTATVEEVVTQVEEVVTEIEVVEVTEYTTTTTEVTTEITTTTEETTTTTTTTETETIKKSQAVEPSTPVHTDKAAYPIPEIPYISSNYLPPPPEETGSSLQYYDDYPGGEEDHLTQPAAAASDGDDDLPFPGYA